MEGDIRMFFSFFFLDPSILLVFSGNARGFFRKCALQENSVLENKLFNIGLELATVSAEIAPIGVKGR